jgi:hypothetical protein
MATSYKPRLQTCFLVGRMAESKKTTVEVIKKPTEKMDLYDRRLTSMCSDISKVQSQVDLSM